MKKPSILALGFFLVTQSAIFAAPFNNAGDITATGGFDVKATGNVQATGNVTAGASVTAGVNVVASANIISTGGNVRAATYLQASQNLAVGGSGLGAGVLNAGVVGEAATASSFSSFVVGRYNVLEGTANSWVSTAGATEPLFVVANGTGTGARNNAFTIYKDGTVTMSKAQGDILMGQFGNP